MLTGGNRCRDLFLSSCLAALTLVGALFLTAF